MVQESGHTQGDGDRWIYRYRKLEKPDINVKMRVCFRKNRVYPNGGVQKESGWPGFIRAWPFFSLSLFSPLRLIQVRNRSANFGSLGPVSPHRVLAGTPIQYVSSTSECLLRPSGNRRTPFSRSLSDAVADIRKCLPQSLTSRFRASSTSPPWIVGQKTKHCPAMHASSHRLQLGFNHSVQQ